MAKARIDMMESGRFWVGDKSFAFTSKTNGVYITPSGGTSQGTVNGQHVVEYAIYTPGKTYTFTYWRPSSSSQLCIAYLDSSNTLIGGVYGSGTTGSAVTAEHTTPSGTAKVRVYGIYVSGSSTYTANASMKPVVAEGVCAVSEIRIKPSGASASQLVWPTAPAYRPVQNTATLVYTTGGYDYITAEASASEYAQLFVTFEKYLGETLIGTEQIAVVPILATNPSVYIDGVYQEQFYLDPNDNTKIRARNLGRTAMDSHGCYLSYFHDGVQIYNSRGGREMVVQNRNYYEKDYTQYNTTGYQITVSQSDLDDSGGDVLVTEYRSGTRRAYYWWASGGPIEYGDVEPFGLEIDNSSPSLSVTLNGSPVSITQRGRTLTFPQNTTNNERQYVITGTWRTYESGSWKTFTSDANVRVRGVNTAGRSYSNLSIQEYSYPTIEAPGTPAYSIPAGGGSIAPEIRVSVMCSVNGATPVLLSHQGYVTDGATSVEVNNGSIRATINIEYRDWAGGIVSAVSRGTNVDSDRTVVAANSNLRIRAAIANLEAVATPQSNQSVYQQQNAIISSTPGTFRVTSFTVTPKVNGATLPTESGAYKLGTAASSTVALDIRASGSGITTLNTYTALKSDGVTHETSGGDDVTMNNEEVNPSSISVTVGGSPVTVTNKSFTADNHHNLSAKTYAIHAEYETEDADISVVQVKDEKISDGTPTYYATLSMKPNTSNTIGAPGGEAFIIATAYHITGTKWKSDNAPVPGESTQTWDTSRISLAASQSTSGAYTVTPYDTQSDSITFRVSHRDMKNNVTTDTLSVYAMNGDPSSPSTYADSSANPVTFSATNAVDTSQTYEEAGAIVWDPQYSENDNYNISFMIDAYTSDTAPAPFVGGSTNYSVQAYHRVAYYHDGTQTTKYWQHYTSWTAEHDDAEHRYLYNTVVTPYTHVFVTADTDWNDTASVAKRYPDVEWVTVNQSNQTITFSAQTVDGSPQRSTSIIATNTSDPATNKVSASKTVYQQAKQSLTASPNRHNFEWDDTQRAIFDITSWYVQFKVAVTGDWISAEISFQNGLDGTWEAVNPDTKYGIVTGARYPKLRVTALSANYGSTMRLAQIDLIPQDTTGLSPVYLQITQDPYGGGPSNND